MWGILKSMDKKERLKEQYLLFLYGLSEYKKHININTLKRYIYLYYMSSVFFDKQIDEITIFIDKGDIKISYLEEILNEFDLDGLIVIRGKWIFVLDELSDKVDLLLNKEKKAVGNFYKNYLSIKPFVNLLSSYNEQFIFTIFFSEPTFQEASERGISEIKSSDSKLSQLLIDFKNQINNEQIDNYDILAHWMNFVLKNYY